MACGVFVVVLATDELDERDDRKDEQGEDGEEDEDDPDFQRPDTGGRDHAATSHPVLRLRCICSPFGCRDARSPQGEGRERPS